MNSTSRIKWWIGVSCGIVVSWFLFSAGLGAAPDTNTLAPLPIKLPTATLKVTPPDLPKGPNLEPPPDNAAPKKRAPFLAPKGVVNVAVGKKVTTSAEKIFNGNLSQITDGLKEPSDDQVVEMRKGTQWIQIDLEKPYKIYAILFWHDHRLLQVFSDVIVQTSNDPDFKLNVTTLFNNDFDNTSGFGIGVDKEYFETEEGKLIRGGEAKARYVRLYSKGNNLSAWNAYQEVEIYALPE